MESKLIMLLALGFLLGMKHALDADHVLAISTIVSENKRLMKSSFLGLFWGLGHTATLLLVGIVLLLFKIAIPEKLALTVELAVGVMLIVLGVSVARRLIKERVHFHFHAHGKERHFHAHSHKEAKGHEHTHYPRANLQHEHKSLLVGMVHGLAGSAAVMLLALSAVKSVALGILYILLFGLGTIIGMTILTTIIGLPFVFTAARFRKANDLIAALAGLTSIALGLVIIYEVGWARALFF